MLERLLGAAFKRVILPIANGLARAGLTANALTVVGFLITLVSAWVIARGNHIVAGLVLLGGALFDTLDGAVARATGSTSKRGAFLDSTLDRLSDAAMFVGLIWRFSSGPNIGIWTVTVGRFSQAAAESAGIDRWGAPLALLCLILSLMVSYVRARAEGLGFECKVGVAERPERIILVSLGLLLNQLVPAMALLALASAITLIQRFFHVWKQASAA